MGNEVKKHKGLHFLWKFFHFREKIFHKANNIYKMLISYVSKIAIVLIGLLLSCCIFHPKILALFNNSVSYENVFISITAMRRLASNRSGSME